MCSACGEGEIENRVNRCLHPCKVGMFWLIPWKKFRLDSPLTKYDFLDCPLKSTPWQLTVTEGNFQLKK
jgi:hypothetical protein